MSTNPKKPTVEKSVLDSGPQKNTGADVDERRRLRDDLTAAVKAAFKKQEPDPRTRFHEQFKKEADEYDRDFRKKYHDDLNSTLIFAGLFSAVASAFILDVQSQIRPDYEQMSFTVLTMLLNTTSGMPNQLPVPTWSGPTASLVQVQSILFASLLSALLAAFLAMLGKQWLNLHVEGSFIDRNRYREQKMRGMISWRFKLVMEFLPLILQASLLLLGYALAQYLWDTSRTISFVITGFTIVGVVLYLLIVVAGTLSRACPFQTPVSIAIRSILEHHRKGIDRVFEAARRSFSSARKFFSSPRKFVRSVRSQAGLVAYRQQLPSPPIASKIGDQDDEVHAELGCILTMFKMTKAPDSVKAIMAYITEIDWDNRLKVAPLLQVYQTLRESLLCSAEGKVYPRLGARDKALWSAKALVHLYNQRRYLHHLDATILNQATFINHPGLPMGHNEFNRDFDLQSTFYVVDWTLGAQPEIPWADLQLSESHHCWLGHTLQYRAFDVLYRQKIMLTDDVRGFVVASLSRRRSPGRAVADCLFIVRMVAGYQPDSRELLNKDRSHQISEIIDNIFDLLDTGFGHGAPSPSSVEALKLVVHLQNPRVCARSYSLFRIVVDHVDNNRELWSSARLCLEGASSHMPPIGDPRLLLKFLHFHMQERATIGSRPIYLVFSALVNASNEETDRGLAAYDFTDPLFIDTTTEALQDKNFTLLRKATIFVLPKLDNYLFVTDKAFGDDQKASRFVKSWSSAIHEFLQDSAPTEQVERKDHRIEKAVIKVLLAIAHLPCLRVHLPKERWTLLKHFPHIMVVNPPPLQRCLSDPNISPFLNSIMDAGQASPWLGMLWMKYDDLSPEVRKQVEEATRKIAVGDHPHHFGLYTKMFDAYIGNLEGQLSKLDPLAQAAANIQRKRDQTAKAKERFRLFQRKTSVF